MRLSWQAAAVGVVACATAAMAEEVSMTAYYPSPRGMYDQLRTSNDTYLATAGGGVGISTNDPHGPLNIAGAATDPVGGVCPEGYDDYDEDRDGVVPENGECRETTMILTADGRIGLGTLTPVKGLDIRRKNAAIIRLESHRNAAGARARILFDGGRGTLKTPAAVQDNDILAKLRFRGFNPLDSDPDEADLSFGVAAGIQVDVDDPTAATDVGSDDVPGRILFYTHHPGTGPGGLTERLRIDSLGIIWLGGGPNVPVPGTTTMATGVAPSDKVYFLPAFTGAEDTDLRLHIEDNPTDQFSIWGNSCAGGVCHDLNFSMMSHAFRADGQTFHRGNVGIGITPPLNTLHVKGGIGLESLAPGGSWNLAVDAAGNLEINANSPGPVNTDNRMLITDTGNVGIGTGAPAQRLHVNGQIRGELECQTITNDGPGPNYVSVATCAADEWLLSGGGHCRNDGVPGGILGFTHSNHPMIGAEAWVVDCWDPVANVDTESTAYAICCKRGN